LIDAFGDIDLLVTKLGGDKARPVWLRPKRARGLMRLVSRGAAEAALEVAEARFTTPRLG
jgi:hypothetical protein